MGWTLDPVALPPTADVPVVEPSGPPTSPGTDASFVPAAQIRYGSGAADVLHDGSEIAAADDLALTDGTFVSDGAGSVQLHLAFVSESGALTVDVPGADGSHEWAAGSPTAGVSYTLGGVTVAVEENGCQVDVAPTELGGVAGTYLCMLAAGGTASGAFIANP